MGSQNFDSCHVLDHGPPGSFPFILPFLPHLPTVLQCLFYHASDLVSFNYSDSEDCQLLLGQITPQCAKRHSSLVQLRNRVIQLSVES
ncbi:hypothetical protein CLOM_g16599 [Closterium sp. NIES-68]|nr:hypothetical protein CLOM_g16599 [Closterium sp. NIES-68]